MEMHPAEFKVYQSAEAPSVLPGVFQGGSGGLVGQAFQAANLSLVGYFMVIMLLILLAFCGAAWTWRNDAVRTIEMIRTDSKEEGRADRDMFQRELKNERELFREQNDLTRRAIERLDLSIGRLTEKIH